jgi:hypothetical protein
MEKFVEVFFPTYSMWFPVPGHMSDSDIKNFFTAHGRFAADEFGTPKSVGTPVDTAPPGVQVQWRFEGLDFRGNGTGVSDPPRIQFPPGDKPPLGSTGETAFELGGGEDRFAAFIRGLEGNIGRSLGGAFQTAGDQALRNTFDPFRGVFRGNALARTLAQTSGGAQGSTGFSGSPGEGFEDFVRRRGVGGLGQSAAGLFRNLIAQPRASFAFDPEFVDPQSAGASRDAIALAQAALGSEISPLLAQNSAAFRSPNRLFQEFRTGTGGGSGNFLEFLRSRLGLNQAGF